MGGTTSRGSTITSVSLSFRSFFSPNSRRFRASLLGLMTVPAEEAAVNAASISSSITGALGTDDPISSNTSLVKTDALTLRFSISLGVEYTTNPLSRI